MSGQINSIQYVDSIACGHCKGRHASVVEVGMCSRGIKFGPVKRVAHDVWVEPATKDQVKYLQDLFAKKEHHYDLDWLTLHLESKVEASKGITQLRVLPWLPTKPKVYAPIVTPPVPKYDWSWFPTRGNFAIGHDGQLRFVRVTTPRNDDTERTFAFRSSDNHLPIHEMSTKIQLAEKIKLLGFDNSAALFGQKIGKCGRCGKTLTSEWRDRGFGKKCYEILTGGAGWFGSDEYEADEDGDE